MSLFITRGVCVCVCGGGGGGGRGEAEWGEVTSYIWHSTDVRVEWLPFSALPGI